MKHPEFAAVGYLCFDTNVYPDKTERRVGGGAYFASQAASLVLDQVGLVTRVGQEFPSEVLHPRVRREGVTYSALPTMETKLVYRSEDLSHRDVYPNWGASIELEAEHFPLEWLMSVQMVLLSTMEPTQQARILQQLRERAPHLQIAVDSSEFFVTNSATRDQVAQNYLNADLVFANRHEYAGLQFVFSDVPRAVVKFDGDGAQYMERGKVVSRLPAPEVEAIDVTGAGDVFAGTFLSYLITGESQESALGLAIARASLSVTQSGIEHLFSASHR